MRSSWKIAAIFLTMTVQLGVAGAQQKAPAKITVHVPERGHGETVVKVNGTKLKTDATTRAFRSQPIDMEQPTKFKVEVLVEPNNYTKIFRHKVVELKGGEETTIDFRKKFADEKIEVRWVPTPDDIVDKMAELAKVGKDDIVYDLGCGDAVMLIRPLQKFHAKKGVGIDIDKKMIDIAKKKAKEAGLENKMDLRVGDILNVKDMSDASVVLLYIGDDLGERLSPVLQKSLKPGARVVSHRFMLGDWVPTRTVQVTGSDGFEYTLHLWIAGEKKN